MNWELIPAGLLVGTLVGATGMGAGSLMAPILISFFGTSAVSAVGTDLLYSAVTKAVGAARHRSLRQVNRELALWMGAGSAPAGVLGVFTLHRMAAAQTAHLDAWLKEAIGIALMLVALAVVIRTFLSIRALWGHELPKDGELTRRHKILAVSIGLGFGFVFGVTSVGAGAFFGMALILLFPLSTRRVVGTDLYHGAIVTIPAAVASYFLLPDLHMGNVALLMVGSVPGILIGSQLTVAIPEKALRGSLAGVLALSSLKMFGAF